jgi:hypothetical protein
MGDESTMKRKQRFKDLMRHRNTLEQGLTFKQIFYEVYSELAEQYAGKDWSHLPIDDPIFSKIAYLKKVMRQARKRDDDFRWLSASKPIKTGNKRWQGPPYEYRYINIKASGTPELLSEINAYWEKRLNAIIAGAERKHQRLQRIIEATSTPEGERQYKIQQDANLFEIEESLTSKAQIDKIINELKLEGRLPKRPYKNIDYNYLIQVVGEEVVNVESLANIFRSLPSDDKRIRNKEVRKLVKDTIEAYHNKYLKTELASNTKMEDFGFNDTNRTKQ